MSFNCRIKGTQLFFNKILYIVFTTYPLRHQRSFQHYGCHLFISPYYYVCLLFLTPYLTNPHFHEDKTLQTVPHLHGDKPFYHPLSLIKFNIPCLQHIVYLTWSVNITQKKTLSRKNTIFCIHIYILYNRWENKYFIYRYL